MDIIVFDSNELPIALGALRALLPQASLRHDRFLDVLAHLHGSELRARFMPRVPAMLAAEVIRDAHLRKRLVQLAVLLTTVDGRVMGKPTRAVMELARALEVDEPSVRILPRLVAQNRLTTRVDMACRMLGGSLGKAFREAGLRGVREALVGVVGIGWDSEAAARHARLADYPLGSLGRALGEHCAKQQLRLPLGRGTLAEQALSHELGHVLSGYDSSPAGEIQQAAFQAGYMRRSGFLYLLAGVIQFQLGIKLSARAEPEVGCFDAEKVLVALARGARCTQDLSAGWDFWAAARRPLEELRCELGILPLPAAGAFHAAA